MPRVAGQGLSGKAGIRGRGFLTGVNLGLRRGPLSANSGRPRTVLVGKVRGRARAAKWAQGGHRKRATQLCIKRPYPMTTAWCCCRCDASPYDCKPFKLLGPRSRDGGIPTRG